MRTVLCLGIAVAMTTPAIAVAADDTGAESDTSEERDNEDVTVRTTERSTLSVEDERFASAMTTRVSTEDLFVRGHTLGDALSRVTGTYLRRSSSPGQPAYLSVRGGNPRQTVVELDGLRLSSSVGQGFDAGQMMTDGIESADVFRGSGAAIYGGGAVTGAMRLNPAQAPEDGWEAVGKTMAGSFGTAGVSAAAGAGDGEKGLRVHGGFRRSRGDFGFVDDQGTEHRRVNNDSRRLGLGATGHLSGDAHRLRMTTMWQTGDGGSPGPSEFQESFRDARVDDHRGLAALRWDGQSLLTTSSLTVDAFATMGAQQRAYHYENENGLMTREPFESRSMQRAAAATGGLVALIGDSHLARLDVEGRLESYQATTETAEASHLQAFRRTINASIADEWLLADDKISLIGALRAEFSNGGQGQGASVVRPLLPALGVIGRVHRQLTLRANLARTFRMPDFDELYLDTDGLRGNPDLNPEEAWTSDAGVQIGDAEGPVVVEAAYFLNSIDSMIQFLPVSAYVFEAQNLENATSQGLEAALQLRLADRVVVDGGYTFTQARLSGERDGTAPQLPGQPRHRVMLESTIDLSGLSLWSALDSLKVLPALHYRSRVNLDNFGNLYNEPAFRLDLGTVVGVTSRIRAGLQIHNLLDHRRAHDSLHRPLPGRAVYGTVEVRGGS